MSRLKGKFFKFFLFITRYGIFKASVFLVYKLYPSLFQLVLKKEEVEDIHFSESMHINLTVSSKRKKLKISSIKKITWFVPDWLNVWGGGHFTIFRFAHFFEKQGIKNEIYIYNNGRHATGDFLQNELLSAFPGSNIKVLVDPEQLTETDIAMATTWKSAYHVKSFNKANFKFYFMQDYEALFYASGTQSLQADLTYKFGFFGITGGLWLKSIFEKHGGLAEHYIFAIDHNIFFPGLMRDTVKRVFFYGRPTTERRAFELGVAVLRAIKKKYPTIEIVIAGLDGLPVPDFEATLLGNLSLKETGELYRSCDVGIALSATNLSYLPLELMGSGCPVISNSGPFVEWFCKDKQNCLIAEPIPSDFLEKFTALYESKELRQKLINGGINSVKDQTWEGEMQKILNYIQKIVLES